MEVFILKNNLKTGLNYIEKIAAKNPSFPILENVLISTEKNYLILMATDLEAAIRYWILAKIEKQGSAVLPAKFFSNYVNSLEIEKICLKKEGNFLLVKNKGFEAKIKTGSLEDFPPFPSFDQKEKLEINALPFVEGLKQVVEFASFSPVKPELSGIYFEIQPNALKLAATDSFRLAEKTLFFEKETDQKISFIIPQRATREIINILADKKGKLTLFLSTNQVIFEFLVEEVTQPKVQIFSRLIEGEYPNYQEIIPKKYKTRLLFSRVNFLNQIKTAGLFSGKTNEIKLKVDPKHQLIEIFSQSPDLGENKSSLLGEIKGEKLEVSFNWRFLAEGLSNLKDPEAIVELSGEEGPAILKPVGDESYFYIVMPIKAT